MNMNEDASESKRNPGDSPSVEYERQYLSRNERRTVSEELWDAVTTAVIILLTLFCWIAIPFLFSGIGIGRRVLKYEPSVLELGRAYCSGVPVMTSVALTFSKMHLLRWTLAICLSCTVFILAQAQRCRFRVIAFAIILWVDFLVLVGQLPGPSPIARDQTGVGVVPSAARVA